MITIGEIHKDTMIEKPSKFTSKKGLDEILYEVTKERSIYDDIKRGSRKRSLTAYKQAYIHKALAANYTMKEVGESIAISEVAIFKMYHK